MNNNIYIKIKNNNLKNRGFSIIEIITYVTLLSLISILVITNMLSLFKNYNLVKLNQEIEYNALSIINRLNHDVTNANSIIIENSIFNVSSGVLTVSIASTTVGVYDKVKFYQENGYIKYMVNDSYIGDLTNKYVNVSEFKIYNIPNVDKGALKIELNIETKPRVLDDKISKKFYITIQLR